MPFIIVFNIIMCALFFLSACVYIYTNFIVSAINKRKEASEKQEESLNLHLKIRKYSFLIFLCLLALLIIVNIIF